MKVNSRFKHYAYFTLKRDHSMDTNSQRVANVPDFVKGKCMTLRWPVGCMALHELLICKSLAASDQYTQLQ